MLKQHKCYDDRYVIAEIVDTVNGSICLYHQGVEFYLNNSIGDRIDVDVLYDKHLADVFRIGNTCIDVFDITQTEDSKITEKSLKLLNEASIKLKNKR